MALKKDRPFRFYRDPDYRWYIDLPEWPGGKADLELVNGADTLLEYISEGGADVHMYISEDSGVLRMNYVRDARDDMGEGAYYRTHEYKGVPMDFDIWLCDVTKFLFDDEMPGVFYFTPVDI